ncbi:RsmD family RNA methyltransferase [uncultured Desulfuromonas sp.]|uniref:RsmD family RNA methyltransferase n=1 Tax=uncultured Desulfuromonas sp. TaxID=181013 RepID=UPI00262E7E6A|nr:RsmD family RNA methyltransferase [uncultured Desulfuromonas sp.]
MRLPATFLLGTAVALHSVAIISFQLALMQILSLTQWHHFAAMVISVALLGFGASGTLLALARKALLKRIEWLLPLCLFASGAAQPLGVSLSHGAMGGFDTYLLFAEPAQAGRLALVNLLAGVPFFLGALALGLVFVRHVERIGTLYFANLLGSGLGGAVALLLLGALEPERLAPVTALFSIAAGWLVLPRKGAVPLAAAGLSALAAALFLLACPSPLPLSPYKDLSRAMDLPGAHVDAQRPSPMGLVQLVSAPALRHAPGLSLAFTGEIPTTAALFVNGDWFGAVPRKGRKGRPHLLDFTTSALPYALNAPKRVLVLHAGTGMEVAQALSRGAKHVVAVEPHRAVLETLAELSAESPYGGPAVTVAAVEPRSWLATDNQRYDLVVLPSIGSFGGGVGMAALREQNILTLEAFGQMWDHLTPEGILCASAWIDYPARAPLRLAATLAEALALRGTESPADHLAAIRSWGTITFCASRSPLTDDQLRRIRILCDALLFDPALLPGLSPIERERHHRLEDRRFFSLLEWLIDPNRAGPETGSPFRLSPPVDDRPFFSQFVRLARLPGLARQFGDRSIPFLEMGYFLAVATFIQLALSAGALIILPLARIGWRRGKRLRIFFYFGGLGTGYMLVEMALIHHFVLYLGHPILAAAAVITTVLTFSGLGSLASSRSGKTPCSPTRAAARVAALLLIFSFILKPLLAETLSFPLEARLFCTLILLAPPAFAMGFPFPLGLKHLAGLREADLPWAWGVNGCLSVVSTALAPILAVEFGFSSILLSAALAYAAASLAGWRS